LNDRGFDDFEDMKVILKRRRTIMEMMEGYQGGNASAQMLSSLICTDNNKESFFRWGVRHLRVRVQ
jgi:hypothetical protein